ncbi:MAG: GNAT family N-acetyltransferase [Clostridium sp.]|uniref:GNAT family N-acetyltransferase n=1 Tax=Clostridium sp. TaxID=1506 RepID=UPI003F33E3AF
MNKEIVLLKKAETKDVMKMWYDEVVKSHNFIEKRYWNEVYEVVVKEHIDFAETYVYKIEEEIVGFISIKEREFIGALFIKENFKRRGIGTELLEFIKCKSEKLLLRVYEKNNRAISFYEKNDFLKINVREKMELKEKEWIMLWRRR